MRFLVGLLALFPLIAAAQFDSARYLGTYRITSGTDVAWGNVSSATNGEVYGKGFSGYLYAAPEILSYPAVTDFYGGGASFGFCFDCGLPGTDDGVGTFSVALPKSSQAGLVQSGYPLGFLDEPGKVTTSPIDVTGAGTYTASFTMTDDVAFGPSYEAAPTAYADFVGHGTVTVDVGPATCYSEGYCGPLQIESVTYAFAPELDPAWLISALTLLGGSLMVLRGRRSHGRQSSGANLLIT